VNEGVPLVGVRRHHEDEAVLALHDFHGGARAYAETAGDPARVRVCDKRQFQRRRYALLSGDLNELSSPCNATGEEGSHRRNGCMCRGLEFRMGPERLQWREVGIRTVAWRDGCPPAGDDSEVFGARFAWGR
jgi:hypothetical protein